MDWQETTDLLNSGQYDYVAQLLSEKQQAAQKTGYLAMAVILAAAQQLCLTCQEFRAEMELHRHAITEADRREKELREQLFTILSLVAQNASEETRDSLDLALGQSTTKQYFSGRGEPNPPKRSKLIQKLQRMLRLVSSYRTDERRTENDIGLEEEKPSTAKFSALSEKPSRASIDEKESAVTSPAPVQPEAPPGALELSALHQLLKFSRKELAAPYEAAIREDEVTSSSEEEESIVAPSLRNAGSPMSYPTRDKEASPEDRKAFKQIGSKVEDEPSPTSTYIPGEMKRRHSFAFYCLGPFRTYQNDQLITAWNGQKGLSILKYLVASRGDPVAKDILIETIWPGGDAEATRRNLHQAIYSLRQTLRRDDPDFQSILFHSNCYLLNPEMETWIDFVEFEKQALVGKRLDSAGQVKKAMSALGIAEGLYQGPFLEDDLYEEWAAAQRLQLSNQYLEVAERLSANYMQHDDYTAAIALCQKILVQDPYYETAHRRLMKCYLAQGQRHFAVRQYQTCQQVLSKDLDLEPAKETDALYQRITQM